ncbi:UDP-N-acetylmuramoyl-tripeptide--D-alanyl-D-alanine ligase [Candidatus Pantoea edessiphila]|uniref:UDP-N-acetylmuramoyl-tripeptide--D-alanyl-D-alanine ligase n=1 Tax=Candidatus Pantoea edessiphila TaxID=2044610 RepID=A0A2P5SWA6_9GAMM|nr:UDP-N-acetylmuramoyl-tripeptide--D-alanyl-D-alanine ligase [Candidatus Pantoea edessiphila]PPI86596.1 UDP-N-acetylmuramoyl-tripeptide--D-alanyl-D-alanine ligase [Candidatus Pantoea edessiphila]
MIPIFLSTLAKITKGKLYGKDTLLDNISIDTSKIQLGTLFIAIIGKQFDAHNFVDHAINQGAKALLVNRYLPISIPQVIVKDTSLALGTLSSWVRNQVKTRVVALTGSAGKTSVKEMTASIFRQCGKTLCNKDNLNNKFGVSLTLLQLSTEHKYAVIELGANHPGEIDYITKITCPESVLVNNIAEAHLEGFGSMANIAKAKGEIFYHLHEKGTAIINDDSHGMLHWKKYLNNKKTWTFSLKKNTSDFFAYNIKINKNYTSFCMHTPDGLVKPNIPITGTHNIYNALAASALSLSIGIPLDAIISGLATFNPIPGRLFPIYLSKNKILLDDSYNSNIGSMKVAIELLSSMPGYRVMVVSDIAELGLESERLHRKLGVYAKNMAIDLVISIGTLSYLISQNSKIGKHFTSKKLVVKYLKLLLFKYENITILIKGSRNANMEEVIKELL